MAESLPIAGWYPDPEIPGHDRWWDGTTWSENRRDASGAPVGKPARATTRSAPRAAQTPPPAATPGRRGAGLYIPGETVLQPPPAPAYAPMPVVRNNLALVGFILSVSGFFLPFVVNSIAGGIVSIIGLRRSGDLPGTGILSNGRNLSIAGILIGFIWGGICLLFVVGFILFEVWILGISTNFQFPDSPVM